MSAWLGFLARRLGSAVALIGIVVSLVFALTYVLPADPARAMIGPHADAEAVSSVRARMCLDRPFIVQYGCFIGRIARGDLGTSFRTRKPVADLLAERVGPTAELALSAILLQLLLSVPLAAAAATRRDRALDRAIHLAVVILQNVPPFVLGPALIYLAAYKLGWLPVSGRGDAGLDRLRHLALPALTLAIGSVASYTRLLRDDLTEVIRKDFIRTARAKGAPPWAIWGRHIFPNAAGPMVALLGMDFGALLGGAAIAEYIFGWPGLGREAVLGILEIDLPVVLGVVVVTSAAVIASNLLADIVHAALDPRLRPR
jgi:peptide/nickel transport system permease protein